MFRILLLCLVLLASSEVGAHRVPDGASLSFITPHNGDVLESPIHIRMMLHNMAVAPVGENIHKAGHHHLLIDVDSLPALDEPIPVDEHHLHFNQGEVEATIELPPGPHVLQLILGDETHEPLGEQLVSEKISVTVQ